LVKQRIARFGAAGQAALGVALVAVLAGLGVTGYALACSSLAAPTITSSPSNPTTSTSATFTYKDSASGVTFKCSLDSAAFATCASTGITYSPLAQGSHTFKVEAVSGSSTSSATSYTWAIVPPTPAITSEPTNPTTSTTAAFKYSDSLSGVSFLCSLNGSSFSSCAATGVSYTVTNGGSNTFSVEAQVGSNTPSAPATYTWTVTTPTPTITSGPANPVASSSATFTYSDSQAGVSFKCSRDSSSFSSCSSSGITYNKLSDGTHTFSVEAVLGSGPASTAATYSWRVDTTAPTVSLTFPAVLGMYTPSSWATGCSPTGICGTAADSSGVKSVGVAILQWSSGDYWNGTAFSSSSSVVFNTATGSTSWDYPFAVPPAGTYSVFVRATDNLGNSTPLSQSLVAVFYIKVPTPHDIDMYSGSPQTTTVNTAFAKPLVAKVTDQYGNPFLGASVTFSAPTSGASGIFASPCSGTTCVVSTNSSGLATSPTFTANTIAGGPYTVTASVTGLSTPANFSLTNTPGPAKKLVFTTSPVSGAASSSATLGPITVQEQDAYGNAVTASGKGVVVSLSSSSTAGIFSATSGGTHITSVTIASGKTSATFYYGDTKADSPTITASSSPLTSATQTETITAAKAAKVVFITSPVTGPASSSTSLGPITVQLEDTYGNPVNAGSGGTTVNLSSSSTGTYIFDTTKNATSPTGASSVTIASGSSSVSFYYGDTKAGSPTITAASSGLTSATQVETITAAAGAKLVITSTAFSATASTSATSAFTTTLEDAFGNPTTSASPIAVNLSSSSSGAKFATASGGGPVTSVTLLANTKSVTAYYADTVAGTPTITVQASGLSPNGSQTETITAAKASKLVFITSSVSGAASSSATLGPITVQLEDTYGNPVAASGSGTVVKLTSSSSGGIFAATSGATHITSITIAAGNSSASFYYGDTKTGSPVITAASSGLTSASQTETITGVATKLVFISSPVSGAASSSATLGPIVVQVQNASGSPVAVATNTTVTLASSSTGGIFSANSTGTPTTTSVVIPAGSSSVSFYYGDTKAGSPLITAASSGLTSATQTETITAGTPYAITIVSGSPQSTTVNTNFANPLVVLVTDAYGNPVPNASVTFTAPSSGASGTFVSSSSNTISVLTGSNGQASSGTVEANTIAGGPYNVSAATSGPGPVKFSLTNTPAAASKLVFSVEPPSAIADTAIFGVAVTIEDTYGNVETTDTNSVALTLNEGSGCSGTLSGTTSKAAVAGVASFSGLQVTDPCINAYTITATDSADGSISVLSSSFTVTAVNFTINGSIPASTPLYPGTGQPVDLVITNPNLKPINLAAGSVGVLISLGPGASANAIANCNPLVNFAMTQSLTTPITIGAGKTESLSDLLVPQADWPVISMIETHTNQDACETTPLSFTWSATGSGS
jgi:hypothetical protein